MLPLSWCYSPAIDWKGMLDSLLTVQEPTETSLRHTIERSTFSLSSTTLLSNEILHCEYDTLWAARSMTLLCDSTPFYCTFVKYSHLSIRYSQVWSRTYATSKCHFPKTWRSVHTILWSFPLSSFSSWLGSHPHGEWPIHVCGKHTNNCFLLTKIVHRMACTEQAINDVSSAFEPIGQKIDQNIFIATFWSLGLPILYIVALVCYCDHLSHYFLESSSLFRRNAKKYFLQQCAALLDMEYNIRF